MNNILVVNVNWLGDAVFSTPVFKTLKSNFPSARISCFCVPRVKRVLESCPFIDEFIVFDEKVAHFWPWSKWRLINQLRLKSFDIAFLLHRSTTRGLLTFLAKIPLRVGYCKIKAFLTHPIEFNDQDMHRADVYLKVLEDYGLKVQDRTCQLNLNPKDVDSLDALLKGKGLDSNQKIIVLHTSGNWNLKRWPADQFAQLIVNIHERFKIKVVLSGGHADLDYCVSINQQANNLALVLAGETSLGQSLALYCRSEVVVSSDSGPLHLAHSAGCNVIGLFGPTRPEITGPRGMGQARILFNEVGCNKAPCYHLGCFNNLCMQAITQQDVLEAIKKFIR